MKERLQKYIANNGVASRRKSEELIFKGHVKVNGKVVNEIVIIDDEIDVVEVEGVILKPVVDKVYLIINKPTGYITSSKDQFGRKTVLDLVNLKERIYPVGRLDYDTSGLLILTNDGDFTYKMSHPSHEIKKKYRAEVIGEPTQDEIREFCTGLYIEDYHTAPADLTIITKNKEMSIIDITIHEGKNRQVRKMCEKINHPVVKLERIAIGNASSRLPLVSRSVMARFALSM
jgi:23S rRNA pseudouridine2605 synthase